MLSVCQEIPSACEEFIGCAVMGQSIAVLCNFAAEFEACLDVPVGLKSA